MSIDLNDFGELVLKYNIYQTSIDNQTKEDIIKKMNGYQDYSYEKQILSDILKYIFDELGNNLINKNIGVEIFNRLLNQKLEKIIDYKIKDINTQIRIESNVKDKEELMENRENIDKKIRFEIIKDIDILTKIYLEFYKIKE